MRQSIPSLFKVRILVLWSIFSSYRLTSYIQQNQGGGKSPKMSHLITVSGPESLLKIMGWCLFPTAILNICPFIQETIEKHVFFNQVTAFCWFLKVSWSQAWSSSSNTEERSHLWPATRWIKQVVKQGWSIWLHRMTAAVSHLTSKTD